MTQPNAQPADPAVVYHPGLDGVIAGESAICQVHADAVLLYRGYDVHELAGRLPFEGVAYLLLHGELPSDGEREAFAARLRMGMELPDEVIEALAALPATTHPMDALRTGVSMAAGWVTDFADTSRSARLARATRLIGVTNAVTAALWRAGRGEEPVRPSPQWSLAGNVYRMCFGRDPEPWQERSLDAMYTLYAEHDFNASTFAARVIVSTLSDLYSGVVGAIGALKGPLHGGANEQAMRLLEEVGSPDNAEPYLREKLARKELIMGFGHRVYKKGDSRVPIIRDLVKTAGEQTGQTHWYAIARALEEVMLREKRLPANADLYAAPLYRMLGIPTDLNTPLFACARVAGWCAHMIEQLEHNRLIRPRGRYTGPDRRAVPTQGK